MPPFAQMTWPVHQEASLVHSIPTLPAISSTYAGLPPESFASATICSVSTSGLTAARGTVLLKRPTPFLKSSVVPAHISVATGPGLTALTVARSASSRAHVLVIAEDVSEVVMKWMTYTQVQPSCLHKHFDE